MPVIVIALVLMIVGLTILSVVLYGRLQEARQSVDIALDGQAEAIDGHIEAAKHAEAAETELGFLKETVVTLVTRPAISVLTETQFSSLVQAITTVVQTTLKPNSLN